MKKKDIKIPQSIVPIILVIAGVLFFAMALVSMNNAHSSGEKIGSTAGSAAGKVAGSFRGLTEGKVNGEKDGRKDGLSAENTTAIISSRIQQMENLEVLVASVKLSNFHTIGEHKDYAALYLINGTAVFSVDMSRAKVSQEGKLLQIILPQPQGKLYIDDSSIEKVGEYQRKFFDGSAEDGFDAYLNTMKKTQEISENTLSNYQELIATAKEAAEQQVYSIAEASSVSKNDVFIRFE